MSMSKLKRRTPAAPAKNPELDKEEKETTPQTEKTMDDLPPEVLTIILEHAILNQRRNNMLVYRLVSSQWKEIADSLVEKEMISRRLKVFPALKIGGQPDQLSVYCPRTFFNADRNPLSFNSLLLNGHKNFPPGTADNQMTFPIFMSKFGSNLTTFALQDQIIATESLAALLGSMSSLKVICFEDVELTRRSIGPGGILQPPPLPNLTTLEIMSHVDFKKDKRIARHALYIWLIASYADQLVCLNLKVYGDPLPALQKSIQYSFPCGSGDSVSIATTSASAFGKLKELNQHHPSPQFLQFTETPVLRQLSITGLIKVNLQDLQKLIGICGNSLQEMSLGISDYAINLEIVDDIPTAGLVARNVKKLTLDYFKNTNNAFKNFNKDFLSMFPALEMIQLLYCDSNERDHEMALYDHRKRGSNQWGPETNDSNLAEEISSLKQQLASVWEHAFETRNCDLYMENCPAFRRAREERAAIFKRLAALGENLNKVIVEQILDHHEVWNICPELKTVSVSSGGKPVGDVCVIERMVDV